MSQEGEDRAGTWVVGHDDSAPAQRALDWALRHAAGRAERIEIVSAWHPPVYGPYPVDATVALPYDDAAMARAAVRRVHEVASEAAGRAPVPVTGVAPESGAAEALLQASAGAGLLVVGSRGRGGFRRLLLGSTSSQCASHARTPTVIVHGDQPLTETRRIVVGVDGSPNSLAAIEWAIRFAEPGTEILAGIGWDNSPLVFGADQFYFPDAQQLAEERIVEMVEAVVDRLAVDDVTVQHAFALGRPRDLLAEWGRDADLVAVGARGHGAVGAAVLGSVTTWLIHHLDRPVAVIPHGDESD